jgi:hypothetical protein
LAAVVREFGLWEDDRPATPPVTPPGLLSMAGSFLGSMAEHAADAFRKASPEVQAERARVCRSCPNHDPCANACRSCGCGTVEAIAFLGVNLSLKRSWASSKCPDDPPRWDTVS